MSMFSIVIPAYNVAPYLRECLDSVVAQTFADWEAICVDDGSTDGSGAILDEYAARDGRFRVIHQANAGVSAARNAALDVAQGEWVWFVDGDDAIHPNALEHIYGLIGKCPTARQVAITPMFSSQNTLDAFNELDLSKFGYRISDQSVVDSVTYQRVRSGGWATIHEREILGDMRFSPFTIGEDVLFGMTAFWENRCVAVSDAPAYYYRQRDGSAVNARPTVRGTDDFLETEIRLWQLILDHKGFWTAQSMHDCLAAGRTRSFYTFKRMFFRLSHAERSKCVKKWLKLQTISDAIIRPEHRCRFYMRLIGFFPFGFFVYYVVVIGDAIVAKVSRLRS